MNYIFLHENDSTENQLIGKKNIVIFVGKFVKSEKKI